MLKIENLKRLIKDLPDYACVIAYEGEGCGLFVFIGENTDNDKSGWIETGYSDVNECNPKKHDLEEFGIDCS